MREHNVLIISDENAFQNVIQTQPLLYLYNFKMKHIICKEAKKDSVAQKAYRLHTSIYENFK